MKQLSLINTDNNNSVSLAGATLTSKSNGAVWTVSQPSGFLPTTPYLEDIAASNIPFISIEQHN